MLGFYVKRSVGQQFTGRTGLRYTTRTARNKLMREQFAVLETQAAYGHETGGGEIVIGHFLFFFIPPEDGLPAIGTVIYRVQHADGLAIKRPLPSHHIHEWLFRGAVLERALPGLLDQWAKRLQLWIERRPIGAGEVHRGG